MEHLMLQQLTECQAPAHNSTVVSMSYDTLRVTQTILLHHNENCAISVTIVRIVCLCVCAFLCVYAFVWRLRGSGAERIFTSV